MQENRRGALSPQPMSPLRHRQSAQYLRYHAVRRCEGDNTGGSRARARHQRNDAKRALRRQTRGVPRKRAWRISYSGTGVLFDNLIVAVVGVSTNRISLWLEERMMRSCRLISWFAGWTLRLAAPSSAPSRRIYSLATPAALELATSPSRQTTCRVGRAGLYPGRWWQCSPRINVISVWRDHSGDARKLNCTCQALCGVASHRPLLSLFSSRHGVSMLILLCSSKRSTPI